jgi:hypothetical protein
MDSRDWVGCFKVVRFVAYLTIPTVGIKPLLEDIPLL